MKKSTKITGLISFGLLVCTTCLVGCVDKKNLQAVDNNENLQVILPVVETNTEPVTEMPITKPNEETTTEFKSKIASDSKKLGTAGRLYLDNGFSVALYDTSVYYTDDTQGVVDNKDSAAIFEFGSMHLIADHKYQGFSIIKSLSENDKVYIKNLDGTVSEYIVQKVCAGNNIGSDLLDDKGDSVYNNNDYDMAIYTCDKDSYHITIVFLKNGTLF